MRLRLALAPYPVRFLVMAVFWAAFWGLGTMYAWGKPSADMRVTVVASVVSGLIFAMLTVEWSRTQHAELVDALSGLDRADRSQAIAAITHGVVPADPAVRHSAIRLGTAFLGDKPIDELKHEQVVAWVLLACMTVTLAPIAVFAARSYAGLFCLVLAVLVVFTCLVDARSTGRILRTVTMARQTR